MKHIFAALVYYFAAAQQTSTVKLPVFFLKFFKKARRLRVKIFLHSNLNPLSDASVQSSYRLFYITYKINNRYLLRWFFSGIAISHKLSNVLLLFFCFCHSFVVSFRFYLIFFLKTILSLSFFMSN